MLIVTFIRHGESLDNLKEIWAGHKDSKLSELGTRQAAALGGAYASTRLDAIFTSDLERAHATALALLNGQPDPKPLFKVDPNLREQYVGDAEGQPWLLHRIGDKSLEDHFRDRQYPVLFDRNARFPKGESLNDVAARAERVLDDLVLKSYLPRAISPEGKDVHVAVVSHGICISELIRALLKKGGSAPTRHYRGMMNTAWTRVTVQVEPGAGTSLLVDRFPPFNVVVTDENQHEHIVDIHQRETVHEPMRHRLWNFLSRRLGD